jgi:hypothetical protein
MCSGTKEISVGREWGFTSEHTHLTMMRRTINSSLKRTRKPISFLSAFPYSWQKDNKFREEWSDWNTHRKEIRAKLNEQSVKRQVKMLVEYGMESAIEIIEQSIFKGWRGLFDLKAQGNIKPDWKTKSEERRKKRKGINVGYQFHRQGEVEEDEE